MDDKELDTQFEAATKRGGAILYDLPKARSAAYDPSMRRLTVDLENGVTLLVPTDLIQGLKAMSDKELADFELLLQGSQIHWRKLDVQMYIKSLIEGIFGTPSWMANLKAHYAAIGAKGGNSRSSAKSAASRQNGKKGGRPREPLTA